MSSYNDMMDFAKQVDNWCKITTGKLNKIFKGITADFFTSIISMTPVDTGRAVSSWFFSAGSDPKFYYPLVPTKASKARILAPKIGPMPLPRAEKVPIVTPSVPLTAEAKISAQIAAREAHRNKAVVKCLNGLRRAKKLVPVDQVGKGEDVKYFLTNTTHYIGMLEYGRYSNTRGNYSKTNSLGFSQQAPAGMVRVNLDRVANMGDIKYYVEFKEE